LDDHIDCGSLVMNNIDDPRSEADLFPIATPARRRIASNAGGCAFRMVCDGIEPGRLALLTGIEADLVALGEGSVEWEAVGRAARLGLGETLAKVDADRAVVTDDGQAIRLTLYAEIGTIAAVELDPILAITLAGNLIDAALLRLSS
jgi:hypothetical protein